MSHVISMPRRGHSRRTAVSDLSKGIPCLVAPRFEHSNLIVRAKQHNRSAVADHHYGNESEGGNTDAHTQETSSDGG
jgi:hypothetical protein